MNGKSCQCDPPCICAIHCFKDPFSCVDLIISFSGSSSALELFQLALIIVFDQRLKSSSSPICWWQLILAWFIIEVAVVISYLIILVVIVFLSTTFQSIHHLCVSGSLISILPSGAPNLSLHSDYLFQNCLEP